MRKPKRWCRRITFKVPRDFPLAVLQQDVALRVLATHGPGPALRAWISMDEMTATELAELSGIHRSDLSRYIRGEQHPQSKNVERIAEACGFPAAWWG